MAWVFVSLDCQQYFQFRSKHNIWANIKPLSAFMRDWYSFYWILYKNAALSMRKDKTNLFLIIVVTTFTHHVRHPVRPTIFCFTFYLQIYGHLFHWFLTLEAWSTLEEDLHLQLRSGQEWWTWHLCQVDSDGHNHTKVRCRFRTFKEEMHCSSRTMWCQARLFVQNSFAKLSPSSSQAGLWHIYHI